MANASKLTLNIATHNAQGLNSPLKRRKLFDSYSSLKLDIIMVQETHFPDRYSPTYLHHQYLLFYLAKAEGKSKGVAILFSKTCNFSWQVNYKGIFILVKGFIDGHLFTFISYYAPNKGQHKFFQSMMTTLNPLIEGTPILGGDSNVAFD